VLHLYVDPNWGDDALAGAALVNAISGATTKPDNLPVPFKTLNGHGPSQPLGAIPRLAVEAAGLSLGEHYRHFVIHVMPGLLGPKGTGTEDRHAPSGQFWNGEVFPIVMLDRISIQGSSALETVIDGRGNELPSTRAVQGHLIEFSGQYPISYSDAGNPRQSTWASQYGVPGTDPRWQAHRESYLDGLMLRGATNVVQGIPGAGAPAAAVLIYSEFFPLDPNISNCLICDNNTGIVVVTVELAPEGNFPVHIPVIQNNTIVRNICGFVDMDLRHNKQLEPNYGRSGTQFLNNIFDNGAGDNTELLGVDGELLRVHEYKQGSGNWTLFTRHGGYVNAFVSSRVPAVGAQITVPCWSWSSPTLAPPRTGVRPGCMRPAQPASSWLEFAPWSYLNPHSSFFVYERLAPFDSFNPVTQRGAGSHDLRTPIAVYHDGTIPAPPPSLPVLTPPNWYMNPCLDQGLDPGAGIDYRRRVFDHDGNPPAYYLAPANPKAIVLAGGNDGCPGGGGFDNDCEGHRNRRAATDRILGAMGGIFGTVDVGADEIDETVICGYQPLTRQLAMRSYNYNPPIPVPIDPMTGEPVVIGGWAISRPGGNWVVDQWANFETHYFPDCTTLGTQRVRKPLLYISSPPGPGYYVLLEVTGYPPAELQVRWPTKPSLLPDATFDLEPAATRHNPSDYHIHPSGLLWPVIGGSVQNGAPPNVLNSANTFDGNGLWLFWLPDTTSELAARYNFVTWEANAATVLVRR
jgi:hypothetical protein